MEEEYSVVENSQRDPRTGRIVASSFWVCGPNGYLKGPFVQSQAQAHAHHLNAPAKGFSAPAKAGAKPRGV